MTIYNIMRGGGLKDPNQFINKTQEQGNPFPHTIGDEYRRGHYALSAVFNPSLIGYQRYVGEDKVYTAGDQILMLYVPEMATFDGLALYVRGDENFSGATITVSYAQVVDGELDETTISEVGVEGAGRSGGEPDLGATAAYINNDQEDAAVGVGYAFFIKFGGAVADAELKLSDFSGSIGLSVSTRVFPCTEQL